MFKPVSKDFDVPALEREVIDFWEREGVEHLYLTRNDTSEERFSFLDGPITANGPMGVHHAWGRTYKDLWQRYNTMLGKRQRYQNGFDCQGLWVEVTTERELHFNSKRDIERYGIAEFVRKCKESVFYFADMQTRQSKRLGQFMDWPNSYYTLSDENNYAIWWFLKTCHERGLLYRGTDVMPWCTRCGTGISETEAAEGYQDLTHTAVYARFPLRDRPGESLLVWTTTPWTLTSNVAVAIDPELTYSKVRAGDEIVYVAKDAPIPGPTEVLEELPGSALLGWQYTGPYDHLPAAYNVGHRVIPWDEVSADEGTGLVHIAPGCGKEDFALGKEFGLAVIAPLDQNGIYGDGFDWLTGRHVLDVTADIVADLQQRGLLYRAEQYSHRYPTCWRCGTELAFRLVDEWFISMDPLREPMAAVVREIRWLPPYGLERELDWLRNMDDWMISKKRYWGLALPFWICPNEHLQVIGGKDELFEKAIAGLEQLEEPHRPWIDAVILPCPQCGQDARRVADVGNPWLDAGIVSFSTMKFNSNRAYWEEWFPADFITESFPGQFRNWFYSLLAMSTVLADTAPFKTVLGYALLRDEAGKEFHKSWGNAIPFDEAADRVGADVMRWLFCLHTPDSNLNFGYGVLDDVKRRLLTLWNTYKFFVTYASIDGWEPSSHEPAPTERPLLDRWLLARLHQTILEVRSGLDDFDAARAGKEIESFIEELSTWYVRRSRRRFWKAESDTDKNSAYATLHESLMVLTRLLAPFMPFLAEHLYQNLGRSVSDSGPVSVHLTDYPVANPAELDEQLLAAMAAAQHIVALGRVARERANLHVRQPLASLVLRVPNSAVGGHVDQVRDIILEELNVRELFFAREDEEFVEYSIRPNLPALGPRYGKRVQNIKAALASLDAGEVARAVERGESIPLRLDDDTIRLAPEDVLVSVRERDGYAAMAAEGFLVALDTRLTPDLVQEGLARQVVRRINTWRKDAGLNVEDRIEIRIDASSELAEAIEHHREYICRETLAVAVELTDDGDTALPFQAEFDGQRLRATIERASVPVEG